MSFLLKSYLDALNNVRWHQVENYIWVYGLRWDRLQHPPASKKTKKYINLSFSFTLIVSLPHLTFPSALSLSLWCHWKIYKEVAANLDTSGKQNPTHDTDLPCLYLRQLGHIFPPRYDNRWVLYLLLADQTWPSVWHSFSAHRTERQRCCWW